MQPRLATPADCARIALLVRDYWSFERIEGFDALRVTKLLEDLLRRPDAGLCVVAESQGALQGYLLAVYMFSLEHGGMMAEIDELFVLPDERATGLGESLLKSASLHMAARGIVRIQLQLGATNDRARRFYERHGFVPRMGDQLLEKPV